MRNTYRIPLLAFSVVLLLTTVSARSQLLLAPPDITISAGYSNIQLGNTNNVFYERNGPYADADFAWTIPFTPVQAGFGVTGSEYYDQQSVPSSSSNFFYPYDHLDSNLGFFELEPRVGVHLGGHDGFFVTPRLGAGLMVDSYGIDQAYNNNGNPYIDTVYHTGAAFELHPAIQVGFAWGPAAAGVEASYLHAWGDFGSLGHSANEYRIGAFFTFRF